MKNIYFILFYMFFCLVALPANEYQVKAGDSLFSIAEKELGDRALWEEIVAKNNLDAKETLEIGQKIFLPSTEDLEISRSFGLEIFAYIGAGIALTWLLYYLFLRMSIFVFQMGKMEQYRFVLTSCKLAMIWLFALCACFIIYDAQVWQGNLINSVLLFLTVMTKVFFLQKDLLCRWGKALCVALTVTIFVNLVLFSLVAYFLLSLANN